MAVNPRVVENNDATPPKQKRKRSPSVPQPAYFVIQILDETGQPMQFEKKRIKLLSVERNPMTVLDMVEGSVHPHALYLRGIIPVARQGQRTPPAAA